MPLDKAPSIDDLPYLATVSEVAHFMRKGRNSIYELVKQKALRAVFIGRTIRIPKPALEAFLASGGESGQIEAPLGSIIQPGDAT